MRVLVTGGTGFTGTIPRVNTVPLPWILRGNGSA
jgi:hypothetical protein